MLIQEIAGRGGHDLLPLVLRRRRLRIAQVGHDWIITAAVSAVLRDDRLRLDLLDSRPRHKLVDLLYLRPHCIEQVPDALDIFPVLPRHLRLYLLDVRVRPAPAVLQAREIVRVAHVERRADDILLREKAHLLCGDVEHLARLRVGDALILAYADVLRLHVRLEIRAVDAQLEVTELAEHPVQLRILAAHRLAHGTEEIILHRPVVLKSVQPAAHRLYGIQVKQHVRGGVRILARNLNMRIAVYLVLAEIFLRALEHLRRDTRKLNIFLTRDSLLLVASRLHDILDGLESALKLMHEKPLIFHLSNALRYPLRHKQRHARFRLLLYEI